MRAVDLAAVHRTETLIASRKREGRRNRVKNTLVRGNADAQVGRCLLESIIDRQAQGRQQWVGYSWLIIRTIAVIKGKRSSRQNDECPATSQVAGYRNLRIAIGEHGFDVVFAAEVE